MNNSIIIAGAGPVGTCLAIDAALRGVSVVILESRDADEPPDAKCNTVAARTMEMFRKFGVSEAVRRAGLPDDYPTDTLYTTSVAGPELTRIRLPSRRERSQHGFIDSHWLTPESMVRVSQLYLEPVLRQKLLSLPNVEFRPNTEVTAYSQDDHGVAVRVRDVRTGAEQQVIGAYLVGCDGGRSFVRKTMGVKLVGDAEIARTRTTLIRSKGVKKLFGSRRPAWMSWIANHKAKGNVVAINGEDLWLIHRAVPLHADFESVDLEQSIRDVLGVNDDFVFEIVKHEDWIGRRLVAERFRDGRVFIAGDAAHLWVPYAGYGMNAGIADAMNLSWLLCAVLHGWAEPSILDAYEAERQPITDQVSRYAMSKMEENAAALGDRNVPVMLSAGGPIGWLLRRLLGANLYKINVPQFAPEGLNYGYYYTGSPIIVEDGEAPPAYDMGSAPPSTVPGCRLGHQHVGKDPDGNPTIRVKQIKTKTPLTIPMHAKLREEIAANTASDNLTFLLTAWGKPLSAAGFGNWFREVCDEAGLHGLSAHGLRKAAARRLAEAGCTPHEIQAIAGHKSLAEVTRYTVAANQERMARTAMNRIED